MKMSKLGRKKTFDTFVFFCLAQHIVVPDNKHVMIWFTVWLVFMQSDCQIKPKTKTSPLDMWLVLSFAKAI